MTKPVLAFQNSFPFGSLSTIRSKLATCSSSRCINMRYALFLLLISFILLSFSPSLSFINDLTFRSQAPPPSTTPYVTAMSMVPDAASAETITNHLVSSKLVACVNTVPGVKSTYWWQGKVHTDTESLLIIKTRASLIDSVVQIVKKHHPYDVPEVIVQPIQGGYQPYLNWIGESTKDASVEE